MSRPPLPPFTRETAVQKVRLAEDAWNTRDPERVAAAYTPESRWRNRSEFINGREEIVAFLTRKWRRELDYRLIKELWAFEDNRIAVRFAYESHDESGSWYRSYGNENWEFDENGLMRRRYASINDLPIGEEETTAPLAAGSPARRPSRPQRPRVVTAVPRVVLQSAANRDSHVGESGWAIAEGAPKEDDVEKHGEARIVDNPAADRFEVIVGGQVAGFAAYHRRGRTVAFTHTVVEPRFEGEGLGSILARGALEAVCADGAEVLPFCPFIRGYIQRHPEYLRLVPAGRRPQFGLDTDPAEGTT